MVIVESFEPWLIVVIIAYLAICPFQSVHSIVLASEVHHGLVHSCLTHIGINPRSVARCVDGNTSVGDFHLINKNTPFCGSLCGVLIDGVREDHVYIGITKFC